MKHKNLFSIDMIQFDTSVKAKEEVLTLLNAIFEENENDILMDLKNDIDMMNISVSTNDEQYYHISFAPKTDALNYDVSFLIDKNTGYYSDIVTGNIIRKTNNN